MCIHARHYPVRREKVAQPKWTVANGTRVIFQSSRCFFFYFNFRFSRFPDLLAPGVYTQTWRISFVVPTKRSAFIIIHTYINTNVYTADVNIESDLREQADGVYVNCIFKFSRQVQATWSTHILGTARRIQYVYGYSVRVRWWFITLIVKLFLLAINGQKINKWKMCFITTRRRLDTTADDN